MYRLCLLGCVVFLAACGEKAPDEGAIRVSVKYGTFKPACVRVEVEDTKGHQEATDIPATQFKTPDKQEVLVAVRRKADWDTALSLTVSSYTEATGDRCSGEVVETRSSEQPVAVPAKEFARWDLRLSAEDSDGDSYLTGATWSKKPDCVDSDPTIHPDATETCGDTVDFNCNQLVGCQEANCWGTACDDGNACTLNDRCVGNGIEARCAPETTKTCNPPGGACQPRQECRPDTGMCETVESPAGQTCDDSNKCTDGDKCDANGTCSGTQKSCTTAEQCFAAQGACNASTGACEFTPLPNTTPCQDNEKCTDPDRCDGSGTCVGTPKVCSAPLCQKVKQVCSATSECEYEPDVNALCTTSGGVPGVCQADLTCSPFPYRPYNFDPATIAAADIGEIKTSGDITFNTADSSWNPTGAISTAGSLKIVTMPQANGNPPVLLIPVKTLELNGTLRIIGPSPVILAAYGDVNLSQSILASGNITNPTTACGTSQGGNGTFGGKTGGGGGGAGNGTPGVAGGGGYNNSTRFGAAGTSRPSGAEPLLGGCPGGNGGGNGSSTPGTGGTGGGAIQLSVARNLTISKAVGASGFGGQRGFGGGAGGGGSGGRIVLEAFQLTLNSSARVTANGGGGGRGGSSTNNDGVDGANGSEDSASPAPGGDSGNDTGGNGGAGGTGTAGPVKGSDGVRDTFGTEGSGGGGGGAAGYIHLRSVQTCSLAGGHLISPPATGGCLTP
ncbi:putative metal-binding motif-containing protein [Corallococcus exiguus]|uniref:putative metal-binding motif-containing protein n=1 Tax=Corallococcus exiguus TaxID=83462 RepID=UPI0015603A04|nr:putative metal-binding motif-containing protein [Corallococcus exiguus]NRD50409.1 hypothetical protein [Corallococcus exiguus]